MPFAAKAGTDVSQFWTDLEFWTAFMAQSAVNDCIVEQACLTLADTPTLWSPGKYPYM
jgi:hypothetical protein